MSKAIVQIKQVSKTYTRGKQKVEVLKALDLEVAQGDFVALMGPSGSGKTTLLNLIGGLDQPTAGRGAGERRAHRQPGLAASCRSGAPARRLRVPVLQPDAGADRAEERRTAAAAHQAVGRRNARKRAKIALQRGRPGRSRLAQAQRAVRRPGSSASPSPARWSPTRPCWSATSRPAISTARPPTRSWACCRCSIASTARPSSWSRTTPRPRSSRRIGAPGQGPAGRRAGHY